MRPSFIENIVLVQYSMSIGQVLGQDWSSTGLALVELVGIRTSSLLIKTLLNMFLVLAGKRQFRSGSKALSCLPLFWRFSLKGTRFYLGLIDHFAHPVL